jgi:2-polyprenyl-3-methyl-5-hydroxy-6-metoxy-1,4-benzoquinol methylase
LSRGVPVIAPNFDGPSETLDSNCQYDLANLDQCVRLIEDVIDRYDVASQDAIENYQKVKHRFQKDYQADLLSKSIDSALNNYRLKEIPFELSHESLSRAVQSDLLSKDSVIESISSVTNLSTETIRVQVAKEQGEAGISVNADMKLFDVVPYQPSRQMDELYRSGTSFGIELAANYADDARLKMAAFILVRLCTERTRIGRNLKILAVGDGIGSDSIRMASAGFDVDYMDYEASVTSKVAAENFKKFKRHASATSADLRVLNRYQVEAGTYDAVISLEVIEHVEKSHEFLDFLYLYLC